MKVLQICSKPPIPLVDGGCKATDAVTQGLLENGAKVKVISLATYKHPFNKEKISKEYFINTNFESVFVDTRIKFLGAFFNLFSSKSYNISRFYDGKFEELIVKNLAQENWDIILLEGLFVMPYVKIIREKSVAKIIYRAHNIEYKIWERNTVACKNIFKQKYLQLLTKRLFNYEKNSINQVDGIAAITENDKKILLDLGCKKPIEVFPFGINLEDYKIESPKTESSIFYIGSMDWLPNVEAIKWFLESVFPKIIEQFPATKFYLAGKRMPNWLRNKKQKNVVIVGEVESAVDFINEHQLMIVPLFSGSGMRIKIIEGGALGKPIIATSIAAEGVVAEDHENIMIANSVDEFVAAACECLANPELINQLNKNVKNMVASNYDNKVIVNNLVQFFKQVSS